MFISYFLLVVLQSFLKISIGSSQVFMKAFKNSPTTGRFHSGGFGRVS